MPLTDLEIGKGQSRMTNPHTNISELADSIATTGLLEPIVVCPGSKEGKFEILTGQRRYLALIELPVSLVQRYAPNLHANADTMTCLRSVLMKPEHEEWLGAIMDILEKSAASPT
ncbi:MAG: ParB N-terminal domain-containing protein [Proteobacteria bacterium]|nr:ParB N-terminal domain-containing protein [Pseudomonadota bacterium]